MRMGFIGWALAATLGASAWLFASGCGTDVAVSADAAVTAPTAPEQPAVAVKLATCWDARVIAIWTMLTQQWNDALDTERERLATIWSCVAAAQACAEVLECWYGRPPIACTEARAWCDGGWFAYCDGESEWASLEDCSKLGEQCVTEGASAGCGRSPCTLGETPPYCDGDVLVECRSPGVFHGRSCAPRSCFPEERECGDELTDGLCNASPPLPVGFPWCEGDMLVVCASLYVRSRTSCRAYDPDFACNPNDACDPYTSSCMTASCGMPPGTAQCNTLDECDGTTLRVCDRGKLRLFDCSVMPGAVCVNANCEL